MPPHVARARQPFGRRCLSSEFAAGAAAAFVAAVKRNAAIAALGAAACGAGALPAAADAFCFGTTDHFGYVADTKLTDPEGHALHLAHRTIFDCLVFPYRVRDGGLVLMADAAPDTWWELPTGSDLAGRQRAGLLPSPLPSVALGAVDYMLGTAAWWGGLIIGATYWLGRKGEQAADRDDTFRDDTPRNDAVRDAEDGSQRPR